MKKFKFYSEKYSNKEAVKNNWVLSFMYGLSYPYSYLFMKLKLTPNFITLLSILACGIACIFLIKLNIEYFILFWLLSILFDFCDGTLARMTKNTRTTLFRYDHMSDLVKFSAVLLSIAIYFDNTYYWIASFSCSFLYMYYSILDHDVVNLVINKVNKEDPLSISKKIRMRDRYKLVNFIANKPKLFNFAKFFTPLISINGHTLLLFTIMPLNIINAYIVIIYLFLLTLIGINFRVNILAQTNK